MNVTYDVYSNRPAIVNVTERIFLLSNRPISFTITLAFILLNSLVWLGFGIVIAVNANPALLVSPYIKWIMAFLSFCVAAIFIGLLIFLNKRSRMAYILTLALLGGCAGYFTHPFEFLANSDGKSLKIGYYAGQF